jgi:adenine-specific DNA-methyltransferase
MGTKRELAQSVATTIALAKPGMLLDAFAGMGAVAEAVAPNRRVWTNDVQHFAHLASTAVFTAEGSPPSAFEFATMVEVKFDECQKMLSLALEDSLFFEARALKATLYETYESNLAEAKNRHLTFTATRTPASCFSSIYAFTYFSLHQCIEIDSARSVLDELLYSGTINPETWNWGILGLGRAALKVANTPGHFAQYLRTHKRTFRRSQRQKKRSIWSEWLISLSEMKPCGSPIWRKDNISTRSDSLDLLKHSSIDSGISVVYCDPPYTDDQYSRFYHVLETLILYDYPSVTGAGLYRPNRFQTPFSIKTKVLSAFTSLLDSVVRLNADLVLSYPSNGLLYECAASPESLLKDRFRKVEIATRISHSHSTFGASKGSAKETVTEQIYLARS